MPSNHFMLCHPLLFLPSIFPCIRVFSNASVVRIRWPKYWNFSITCFKNEASYLHWVRFSALWTLGGTLYTLFYREGTHLTWLFEELQPNLHPLEKKGKQRWWFERYLKDEGSKGKWFPSDNHRGTRWWSYFLFYWNIVDLQCRVTFSCIAKWLRFIYIYMYSSYSLPLWFLTDYWIYFPVLYKDDLYKVIFFIYLCSK